MSNDVRTAIERAISVRELIDELETYEPDAKVFFTCSYGDYHNTPQVLPVIAVDSHIPVVEFFEPDDDGLEDEAATG